MVFNVLHSPQNETERREKELTFVLLVFLYIENGLKRLYQLFLGLSPQFSRFEKVILETSPFLESKSPPTNPAWIS